MTAAATATTDQLFRVNPRLRFALELLEKIVRELPCPVIGMLSARDPVYVHEAARRGVFAYIVVDTMPEELQSAIDITLQRFSK